jgi:LysR family cys regulon transcriptional activator
MDVALTARDADVIKTYVRAGLGVGILASIAIDPVLDADLVTIDAAHLLEGHTSWIGFRRGALLRTFMYDFIRLLAPHLSVQLIRKAEKPDTQDKVDRLLAGIEVPHKHHA